MPTHLETIVDADAASWVHPNRLSLSAASRAAERGLRLAIFSNAPVEIAKAVDSRDWLAEFFPRMFSCNLRTVKPEPAAYLAVLEALKADPGEVVFLDDREENVIAARNVGMRAEVFTDPLQFDEVQP
jgi:putative hydrolase of the HAD superfamily